MEVRASLLLPLSFCLFTCFPPVAASAGEAVGPYVAGSFYPAEPQELSRTIDDAFSKADSRPVEERIRVLISPHAGYGYSGQTAAYGYKLIQGGAYKTVVVLGTAHRFSFGGISVYREGVFRTPLGDLEIDDGFARRLINKDAGIYFEPRAFEGEHSVETQLPFLQKSLSGFKIVPVVIGDVPFSVCAAFAAALKDAIGSRGDVLVVVSTDMYHGYDYDEADAFDSRTLAAAVALDAQAFYYGLREGKIQMCGGYGVVSALLLAKESGWDKVAVLRHTNSADVTGRKAKGIWTVGYAGAVIMGSSAAAAAPEKPVPGKGEGAMLNTEQRKKLLVSARSSIQTYLKDRAISNEPETDPLLKTPMGAFVTLNKGGQLRGCIGNMSARKPLYQTIRTMAVEAAVRDPRFEPVTAEELKDIEIEISVLSPLQRVASADEIVLGKHGVVVQRGFSSGVYLPQVASETGWSREEFLSSLCAHKAGLPADAWKDKSTEIYVFTAEVFSEHD